MAVFKYCLKNENMLDTRISAKLSLALNEKVRKVSKCQVKTNNLWALLVDPLLSPTWTLTEITVKGGDVWGTQTDGHFVGGHCL